MQRYDESASRKAEFGRIPPPPATVRKAGKDMPNSSIRPRTLKVAKMLLMAAIAVICAFISFPILPIAPHMEYELSGIPILIAGFVFGPVRGLVIGIAATLVKALVTMPPIWAHDLIMSVIAVGVLVFVSAAIYQQLKTSKILLLALIVGGVCATAAMIPANLIVTPLFLGIPVEVMQGMLVPIIIPFNLLKMAINTVAVFLLYKWLSPFLLKW